MKILSCAFNMDTACVELKFDDGSMIAIDTIAVENEIANNMYQRSELDYLIYNDPVAYADLILNGIDDALLLGIVSAGLGIPSGVSIAIIAKLRTYIGVTFAA